MFRFPRTNLHELNLDWILNKIKSIESLVNKKLSDYPNPSNANPQALGAVSPGTSTEYARADHVHPLVAVPIPSGLTPQPLGTASAGSSYEYSRADHVHKMPSASDIGAQEELFAVGTGVDAVYQIVQGDLNEASGNAAVALGSRTVASGMCSFAVGTYTGGNKTTASGSQSVAMGLAAVAEGNSSIACGQQPNAKATISQAFGNHTISNGRACFVAGQYNVEDTNAIDTSHGSGARKYIFIIGNGTAENARSNGMCLDWDGVLTVGHDPVNNMDVVTKGYLDTYMQNNLYNGGVG